MDCANKDLINNTLIKRSSSDLNKNFHKKDNRLYETTSNHDYGSYLKKSKDKQQIELDTSWEKLLTIEDNPREDFLVLEKLKYLASKDILKIKNSRKRIGSSPSKKYKNEVCDVFANNNSYANDNSKNTARSFMNNLQNDVHSIFDRQNT